MSFIGSLGSHQPKGIAGVRDFLRFKAMLTSHQWVSAHHPDPEGQQLKVFQAVMMNLLNGSTEAKPTLCSEIISVAGRSRSVWVALGYRPFFLLHMGSLRCPATERSLETFEEKWGDQRRFHQLQIPVESARVCACASMRHPITARAGDGWCRRKALVRWRHFSFSMIIMLMRNVSTSSWFYQSFWAWQRQDGHPLYYAALRGNPQMRKKHCWELAGRSETKRFGFINLQYLLGTMKPCKFFFEWLGQSQPARHPRMNTKKDHRLLWQRWRRTVTAWSVRRPLHHQRIWCPISLRFWRHTSCQRTFAFHQPHCQPCKQKRRPRIFAPAALLLQIGCDINGGVWYQTPSRPPPRLPGSRCVASAVVGPWGTFFATRMTRERTTRRVAPQDPDPMVSMA